MSISGVSSVGSAMAYQRPSGPGKEIREGVDALKKAIESGDLEATQEAYDSLSELAGDTATDTNNPLSKMLESVGKALESGDISQIQQAFADAGPKGPRQGGGLQGGPPPGGGRGGPPPEMREAMGQLGQSLQSGDLLGAQSAYETLSGFIEEGASSATSSAATASSSSPADRFRDMLGQLGSALETGNLSSAQTLFASMVPRGSQGVNVTV